MSQKQGIYRVVSNEALTPLIYRMVLEGDTSALCATGQFVNLKIDGLYLRRPISVCDWDATTITLIYKVVGKGTEIMAKAVPGQEFDVLTGLGNGYNTDKGGDKPLLLGGGVGIPPLYALCKKLIAQGKKPTVILGFNKADEIFLADEFRALGADVIVCTADGSVGVKGFVTDAMKNVDYDYFYTCGPMPMFKAIEAVATTSGQYSFEERMGCGFGACMGCSCRTVTGYKRICREGPVLEKEEILWDV